MRTFPVCLLFLVPGCAAVLDVPRPIELPIAETVAITVTLRPQGKRIVTVIREPRQVAALVDRLQPAGGYRDFAPGSIAPTVAFEQKNGSVWEAWMIEPDLLYVPSKEALVELKDRAFYDELTRQISVKEGRLVDLIRGQ